MPIASCKPTASNPNISAVMALKTISWYLPHNDTTQNPAIIQREALTQHVQAHSLTLVYRGRARTIMHTVRMLIFALKVGVGWMQVWWAQAKKPRISPFYTPLGGGGDRTKDSVYGPGLGVPKMLASVARLPTVDDISTPTYSSRPRATTTIHALEIYQPASSTESSLCCSGAQLITLLSICVITLVLIITASSMTPKPKVNSTSDTAHPIDANNEIPEHPARPSSTVAQSDDSDTEDTDGGGTGLPNPAEKSPIPIPRNRVVHAHHEVDDVASFPSRLRGGRRNVSVHWHREHAREVRRDELYEKRKRMADNDWRVRAGDRMGGGLIDVPLPV